MSKCRIRRKWPIELVISCLEPAFNWRCAELIPRHVLWLHIFSWTIVNWLNTLWFSAFWHVTLICLVSPILVKVWIVNVNFCVHISARLLTENSLCISNEPVLGIPMGNPIGMAHNRFLCFSPRCSHMKTRFWMSSILFIVGLI